MFESKRICFVQTSRTYYGAERSLATMAKYLVRRGWGVKVVSLAPGEAHDAFVAGGLDAVCYPATRLRDLWDYGRTACRLASLFGSWRPNIVAANSTKAFVYAAPPASVKNIPKVIFARGIRTRLNKLETMYETWASLWRPDIFIANSQATLASYTRRRYLRARHADFIYPPCEPPVVERDAPPGGWPYFVSVGRLHPEKGHAFFVEAASTVAAAFPEVRYLIVGGRDETVPGYLDELEQIAGSTGLDGRLEFFGYRRDVTTLLQSAVAYVNAHMEPGEPFGKVIIEAMQFGVPVIATDCGGPRELVVDGETGFLVPPGDAAALAAKMKALLDNPTMVKRMGEAGRRRAAAEFAPAKSLSKLDRLLSELA